MNTEILTASHGRTHEPEPFDTRKIDPDRFKTDLSPKDWLESATALTPADNFGLFAIRIETLSAAKMVGKGRTNLTLIRPTIVQTDATTPYMSFDMTVTPDRQPVVQIHFAPAAYGITAAGTYVFVFAVDVTGSATFDAQGYAAGGTITNAGGRTLSGKTTASLVMKNVPANAEVYAYLQQTSGAAWNCYSVRVQYPPLVFTP